MSDDPRSPELDTLLELAGIAFRAELRVSLPGKIMAYDADTQMASVKPLIMDVHIDAAEKRQTVGIPEVHGVPVFHMGTPRGRITFPVKKGDLCWLMFTSSSIKRWLKTNGSTDTDPGNTRHHDINDAFALVGAHASKPPTTAPVDAVVLHADAGIAVKIGGPTGTQKTLMADDFKSALDALITGIKAGLVAAGNTSVGGAAIGTTFEGVVTAFDTAYAAAKTAKTEVK